MNIGNRLEMFTDHYLIDKLDGAALSLQKPRSSGVALRFDKPWEGSHSFYITILQDGNTLRMYYRGQPALTEKLGYQNATTCYAESSDGISWSKPELGLWEVLGSRANNVVFAGEPAVTNNFCPFIDLRPGVPSSERFKAMAGRKAEGVIGLVSDDGITWKKIKEEPIIPPNPMYALDSQNVAFWSEHVGCYVFYFRTFADGVRSVARTTSPDFESWSDAVVMDFGDPLTEHLYVSQTHPYYRASHIYIALPARFMPNRSAMSDEEGKALGVTSYVSGPHKGMGRWNDVSETVLMTSRGGNRYDWTFKEAFVRPGTDRLDWIGRSNYAALGVIPTGPEEMSLYIQRNYPSATTYVERLTLRVDGFASVNAPYSGGEMITKPFTFEGRELVINYSTGAAGQVQVEIQDDSGKPFDGLSLTDSKTIIGDQIERVVTWKQNSDVSRLAGQDVRLRFVMKDADLFSVRFR